MAEVSVPVVRRVLAANERLAGENRARFREAGVLALNLMSSPGAGKTSLLERTIGGLSGSLRIAVIEGDIQTSRDAERVRRHGAQAVQIETGGACHLDAAMVREALDSIDLSQTDILVIENVGNLVCPAEFDLGEHHKAVMLSLAEGDDKPLKYPLMFRLASVLLVNKTDLAPFVDASAALIRERSLALNPAQRVFDISCRTGEGLEAWFSWLRDELSAVRGGGAGGA